MKNFIDLHLHLDGSLPYPTVKKLMKAHNFPSLTETQLKEKLSVSKECANLQEYLTKFDFPLLFLQTKKDIRKMSYDFNMIKKPVISFAKKKQDTEKHSSFV